MTGLLRIHRMESCSLANGPGMRFVIWLQGCPFSCRECFNREARALEGGKLMDIQDIVGRILSSDVHGLTLTGGEPFLQAPDAAMLLKVCGRRGLDRIVYSGFLFSDLKRNKLPGTRDLLKETDLLLDGPYRKDIPPDGEWTGSGNQRVIALSPAGMVLKKLRRTDMVEREYIIGRDGKTVLTGI